MRILACMLAALAFSAHAALTAPASEIIGKRVLDPARADLGLVEDLIVDLREGRVHYAVLGFGGWAGLFDKQFAIPIEEFMPAPFGDKLVLERAKEQYVRARALLERDVVARTGEALGDLRPVAVQKLLAAASGAALVLNIERQKEQP
jgi:sporulation protein YlmC with PRC-barrel domain